MRRWWWLLALAPTAVATRALQAEGALLYPDGYQYLLMAKGIAAHGRPIVTLGAGGDTWLPNAEASLKPLFPTLVAALHVLGLSLRAAAEVVTAAASAAVCVLVGGVVSRLTGSGRAALAAGLLCVASPALGHWATFSGPDPLAEALALGAALALLHRRPGLAGALGGLCVAARPEYALLVLPLSLLSLRFAVAACAGVAAILLAVRPPLALNTAATTIAAAPPDGLATLLRSDWPLLAVAAVGLVLAPRRHAVALAAAASALALVYTVKDPGSARYFAALAPWACVAAGYAIARRPGVIVATAAAGLALFLPRAAEPPAEPFDAVAARLPGTAPLYTAAPDAYGLMLRRPIRFLRPGARGLILVDAAQRTYEPELVVHGRLVRTIAPRFGFVRPDGSVDAAPARLVRGTARYASSRYAAGRVIGGTSASRGR